MSKLKKNIIRRVSEYSLDHSLDLGEREDDGICLYYILPGLFIDHLAQVIFVLWSECELLHLTIPLFWAFYIYTRRKKGKKRKRNDSMYCI